MRPKRSRVADDQPLLVLPLGHVAGHRQRPVGLPELAGEAAQGHRPAGRQGDPVAGRRGGAGGRRSDAARGAGDEHHGARGAHPSILRAYASGKSELNLLAWAAAAALSG